jgi:6-phosphofructokinase 1
VEHLYAIGRAIDTHRIDALLIVGGYDAYEAAARLVTERGALPGLDIPIVCLPATIDNNLPRRRADRRGGHRAEQHRRGHRPDQAVRLGVAPVLRRRDDGPRVRLSRAHGGLAGRRRAGVSAGGGHHLADLQSDVERDGGHGSGEGRRLFLDGPQRGAPSTMYTTDFLARLFEPRGRAV